jgi:catechol 2,3-dioxygenase-like lactoylglutathione lyase family enzyme
VAAPPGCEPAARRFYGELLGMTELEKPDELKARGGVWFACGEGGQQLHVGVEQDFRPAAKAHPAFSVTELPPGLDVVRDGPRLYTQDPWGNRIELVVTSSAPR